jgi:Flp pilus assembly protein TadG
MRRVRNEEGFALVFATLMIVLLLIMVGMGLDTGHLAYVRSQGQPAIDAAALAAASAIPTANWSTITGRAASFNDGGTNPGTGNDYLGSPNNLIDQKNVTLILYDNTSGTFTTSGVNVNNANGARVALENKNPYGGTSGKAMKAPLFLAPLFNLFGQPSNKTMDVAVSAVAVNQALPGLPIVVSDTICQGPNRTVILDFQTGTAATAAWETYEIDNASTSEVRELWKKLPFCAGQPNIDIGYCGNVANGVNQTIVDDILKPMVQAHPERCYLLPVSQGQGNFTGCRTIADWASYCPDPTNAFPSVGKLKGTVTCGQSTWTSRDTQCYVQRLVRDKVSGM